MMINISELTDQEKEDLLKGLKSFEKNLEEKKKDQEFLDFVEKYKDYSLVFINHYYNQAIGHVCDLPNVNHIEKTIKFAHGFFVSNEKEFLDRLHKDDICNYRLIHNSQRKIVSEYMKSMNLEKIKIRKDYQDDIEKAKFLKEKKQEELKYKIDNILNEAKKRAVL